MDGWMEGVGAHHGFTHLKGIHYVSAKTGFGIKELFQVWIRVYFFCMRERLVSMVESLLFKTHWHYCLTN